MRPSKDRPGDRGRSHRRPDHATGPFQPPRREAPRPPGTGQVWIYGKHPVLAALANPERRVFRLLLTQEAAERSAAELTALPQPPPQAELVIRERIAERLPAGAVHQGFLAAVSPLPEAAIEDIIAAAGEQALVLALDQVTDPHNVGAILRSAEAFGAQGVIVTERHAPEE